MNNPKNIKKVICIGGAAIDLKATSKEEIIFGSISPGQIIISYGGVARNIAENISRLGITSYLLTFVGDDILGELVINKSNEGGVKTEFIKKIKNSNTATSVRIINSQGDVEYGIFDGSIFDKIVPEYLSNYIDLFKSSDLLVVDTNLEMESLKYMASISIKYDLKLCVNTVSIKKAKRVLPIINNISVLGSNVTEIEQLVGYTIKTKQQAIKAGKSLISSGVKEVIITLGERGIVYCSPNSTYMFDAIATNLIDTTGAGDALLSGYLFSILGGHDVIYSLKYGIVLASQNIKSSNTVNISLSSSDIENLLSTFPFHKE